MANLLGSPLESRRSPHGKPQSPFRRVSISAAWYKSKTVHKRFTRWAKAGVWEKVFASLTGDPNNRYLMLDTTLVRAHQQAASGKGGPKIRLWGAPEED
jgi:transposase